MEQTTANFETRWRRHTKRMRRDRKLRAAEEEEWGDVTTHTSGGCQGSCAGARGRFVGQFHRNCSIDTDDELFEEECDELQIDWRAALHRHAVPLSTARVAHGTRHLPDLGEQRAVPRACCDAQRLPHAQVPRRMGAAAELEFEGGGTRRAAPGQRVHEATRTGRECLRQDRQRLRSVPRYKVPHVMRAVSPCR